MKRFNKLLKYELLTILKGGYTLGFGLIFPIVLFYLIYTGPLSSVPEQFKRDAVLNMFLGISTLIPLASIFLSHAANYSREYEEKVPQRLNLFGIKSFVLVSAKLIAQLIFVVIAMVIYYLVALKVGLETLTPTVLASIMALTLIASLMQFLLAHALVIKFKAFGPVYGISMILYFFFMIVSGNFAIRPENLPEAAKFIGEKMLPFLQFTNFNTSLVKGEELQWSPLISSHLIFAGMVLAIFALAKLTSKRSV